MTIPSPALESLPADIRSLVAAVMESRSFQRLKSISFLGAIDRFEMHRGGSSKTSGSRFDHSLGVAEIVFSIADKIDLTPGELRIAVVNALLHDIGHGPFSHSSEPYFSNVFNVDHHKVLGGLVEDTNSEISKILRGFGLWYDYRKFVRTPPSIPAVHQLFFGPINVDTIEGIVRSAKYFEIDTELNCKSLADSISRRYVQIRPLDLFWSLKSAVYNEHIFASNYAFYDEALTRFFCAVAHKMRADYFYLDDESLETELGDSFLRLVDDQNERFAMRVAPRIRNFKINRNVQVRRFGALESRYAEVKNGAMNGCGRRNYREK